MKNVLSSDASLSVNWQYAVIERFNPDSLSMNVIPFDLGKVILEMDEKANLEVQPGDVVTIFSTNDIRTPQSMRPAYVTLEGEVHRVGTYRITKDETLHSLIQRVGGLTEDAYLFGTRFLRKSAADLQMKNYERVIDEIERQTEAAATRQLSGISGDEQTKILMRQITAQREWVQRLRQFIPDGRLVLELRPTIKLKSHDLPDIRLEDGDRIVIPSIPSTVSVFGEVPMQNAFLFKDGSNVRSYLKRSGGKSKESDKRGVFLIRADGSVICERDYGFLFWQLGSVDILPGDAVFVPKDIDYSRFMASVKDWSQVLANFGISAASIVTLISAVEKM